MSFQPPEWCTRNSPSSTQVTIEIIKEGVVLDTLPLLPLTQAYFTFGRAADQVDIPLDHPSVSRIHAVLLFKGDHEVYLYDNRSTHGTYVNKHRISTETYTKLLPGAMIRFGESTRTYVVDIRDTLLSSPASLSTDGESGKSVSSSSVPAKTVTSSSSTSTVSHPPLFLSSTPSTTIFRNCSSSEEPWFERLNVSLLNEKEQLITDRLRKKHTKLTQALTEIQKIKAKELSGLTQNQIITLAKNEETVDELRTEIENDEDLLKDRLETRFPHVFKQQDMHRLRSNPNSSSVNDNVNEFNVIDNDDEDTNAYDKVQKSSVVQTLLGSKTTGNKTNKPVFVLKKSGANGSISATNTKSSSVPTDGTNNVASLSSSTTVVSKPESQSIVTESVGSLTKKLTLIRQELLQLVNEEQAYTNDQLTLKGNINLINNTHTTTISASTAATTEDSLDTYMAQTTHNIFQSDGSQQQRQENIRKLKEEEERIVCILKVVQTPFDTSHNSSTVMPTISSVATPTSLSSLATDAACTRTGTIEVASFLPSSSSSSSVPSNANGPIVPTVPTISSNPLSSTNHTGHSTNSLSTILQHYHKDMTAPTKKPTVPHTDNTTSHTMHPAQSLSYDNPNVPSSDPQTDTKGNNEELGGPHVSLPSSFLVGVGLQPSSSSSSIIPSQSKKRSHSPTGNVAIQPPTSKPRIIQGASLSSTIPSPSPAPPPHPKYDSEDVVDLTVFQSR